MKTPFFKDVPCKIKVFRVPGVLKSYANESRAGSKNGPRKSTEEVCFWGPFLELFLAPWVTFGLSWGPLGALVGALGALLVFVPIFVSLGIPLGPFLAPFWAPK